MSSSEAVNFHTTRESQDLRADDFVLTSDGGSEQDREFDAVIEALQDILMDDKFIRIHRAFLDKHCAEFEDTEENKLCYTSLFREYVTCIEGCIEEMIKGKVPNFDAGAFVRIASTRPEEDLCGDVIELLLSLGDFSEFKALMISHRLGSNIDSGSFLHISSSPISS